MQSFYNQLVEQKKKLENVNFSLMSEGIFEQIINYQDSLKTFMIWQKQVDHLKMGEQLLIKQKCKPKDESISVKLVETTWKTYKTIFNTKKELFEKERLKIKEKILDEEKSLKI